MDASRVLDLLADLHVHGLDVWLEGGWGIDALLGGQTREHDDLDLVARLEDAEEIQAVLSGRGYVLAGGGAPMSFELVDPEGHQVDVHPVSFTPSGDGIYKMREGGDWVYPAHGFEGRGHILGQRVRTLTADSLMRDHTTGYALDEDHVRDVIALSERFALPIPAFEREA